MPAPDRFGRDPFDEGRRDDGRLPRGPAPDSGFARGFDGGFENGFDGRQPDPALARALRDLDLPGPVVPSWAPAEVRRRGDRRRTRRRAVWAGSGLVAAALTGVLVAGSLMTGDDGPSGRPEAASQAAAVPPPPSSTAAPRAATPIPSQAPRAAAVTLDLHRQLLRTHIANGAGTEQTIPTAANKEAVALLAKPTTLRVTAKVEHQTLPVDQFGGRYDVTMWWAVVLATQDNETQVHVLAPPGCTEARCFPAFAGYAVVGVFGDTAAKAFYDAVEIDDTVQVIGDQDTGEGAAPSTATAPAPSTTSPTTATRPPSSATGKPSEIPTVGRSSTPRPTGSPTGAPSPTGPEPATSATTAASGSRS